MLVLQTERLLLRLLEEGDAPFMLELMNEPAWLEHIGDRGVRTEADARAYIARAVVSMQGRHGFSLLCVLERASAAPIGICGLVQRDALPAPDLGFAFLQRWTRRGFAREAAEAVVAHAHSTLRLPRILAVTSPGHERSLRLLQRIGSVRTGTTRLAAGGPESVLLSREADGFVAGR